MFFLLCECDSLAQRFDGSDNTRRVSISLHDDSRQLVAVNRGTVGKDLYVRDKADGRVRPSAECVWWFEKRCISSDGTGRHMVGPRPGVWGWGAFCVWTSEIGSLVTPDLDVCVWVPGNQTGRTPHPRGDVNESPDDADVTVYQDPDWSST